MATDYGPMPVFEIPKNVRSTRVAQVPGASPAVMQALQTKRDATIAANNAKRRNMGYLRYQLALNDYQMGVNSQYGDSFREQLDRNRDQQVAQDKQNYMSRGLTNSTLNNQRGVYADYGFQKRGLEDQLLANRQGLVGQRGQIIGAINDPTMSFSELQAYGAQPQQVALNEALAAEQAKAAKKSRIMGVLKGVGKGVLTAGGAIAGGMISAPGGPAGILAGASMGAGLGSSLGNAAFGGDSSPAPQYPQQYRQPMSGGGGGPSIGGGPKYLDGRPTYLDQPAPMLQYAPYSSPSFMNAPPQTYATSYLPSTPHLQYTPFQPTY